MKKLAIFLVLIAAALASRWLFKPGYFLMHDDLQMMRQLQMEKCWHDRQIPCRWVPDMGYGYGYPLFNFYPPLPYYVGQIFRWLGFAFTTTAKLTFALQFFLSGITMFVLAADLWGVWGGLLSAIFYIWAPYHSVDVFVRGAMNEAWAFVWFPLIFWSAKKLIENEKLKYLVWLAFSYAMLLLSHNIMVMIFTPLMLIWIFFWMIKLKKLPWQNRKLFGQFFLAGLWALGLAAFFTLPMFFEKKYTHIETMFSGYFDWRAHFVSLRQLFISRFWGYGPSLWGEEDGMSFSVGHFHWIIPLFILGAVIVKIVKFKRLPKGKDVLFLLLFFLGLFYLFLIHQRSVPLWLLIKPLQLSQFPWRLLSIVTFISALIVGFVFEIARSRLLVLILSILVITFNWQFFKPEAMGPLSDREKFSGKAWEIQQTASIYDYLPKSAKMAPQSPPSSDWSFVKGEGVVTRFEKGSCWFRWIGRVEKAGQLQFNVFYFPSWRAWVDEKEVSINYDEENGMIAVPVSPGEHDIYLRFTNTPIRAWSNLISLLSWWVLLGVIVGPRIWKLVPKS